MGKQRIHQQTISTSIFGTSRASTNFKALKHKKFNDETVNSITSCSANAVCSRADANMHMAKAFAGKIIQKFKHFLGKFFNADNFKELDSCYEGEYDDDGVFVSNKTKVISDTDNVYFFISSSDGLDYYRNDTLGIDVYVDPSTPHILLYKLDKAYFKNHEVLTATNSPMVTKFDDTHIYLTLDKKTLSGSPSSTENIMNKSRAMFIKCYSTKYHVTNKIEGKLEEVPTDQFKINDLYNAESLSIRHNVYKHRLYKLIISMMCVVNTINNFTEFMANVKANLKNPLFADDEEEMEDFREFIHTTATSIKTTVTAIVEIPDLTKKVFMLNKYWLYLKNSLSDDKDFFCEDLTEEENAMFTGSNYARSAVDIIRSMSKTFNSYNLCSYSINEAGDKISVLKTPFDITKNKLDMFLRNCNLSYHFTSKASQLNKGDLATYTNHFRSFVSKCNDTTACISKSVDFSYATILDHVYSIIHNTTQGKIDHVTLFKIVISCMSVLRYDQAEIQSLLDADESIAAVKTIYMSVTLYLKTIPGEVLIEFFENVRTMATKVMNDHIGTVKTNYYKNKSIINSMYDECENEQKKQEILCMKDLYKTIGHGFSTWVPDLVDKFTPAIFNLVINMFFLTNGSTETDSEEAKDQVASARKRATIINMVALIGLIVDDTEMVTRITDPNSHEYVMFNHSPEAYIAKVIFSKGGYAILNKYKAMFDFIEYVNITNKEVQSLVGVQMDLMDIIDTTNIIQVNNDLKELLEKNKFIQSSDWSLNVTLASKISSNAETDMTFGELLEKSKMFEEDEDDDKSDAIEDDSFGGLSTILSSLINYTKEDKIKYKNRLSENIKLDR